MKLLIPNENDDIFAGIVTLLEFSQNHTNHTITLNTGVNEGSGYEVKLKITSDELHEICKYLTPKNS